MTITYMKKYYTALFAFSLFFIGTLSAHAEGEVTVHLSVYAEGSALFDEDVTVAPCAHAEETPTANAFCALSQSGLSIDAQWSDFGVFVNGIESFSSDFANNYYWNWFADGEYGQTSLDQHVLSDGETLLLTYHSDPLRITGDDTPSAGSTTPYTVEQFGFDDSFNAVWNPIAGAHFFVDGNEMGVTNESGIYELPITFTDPAVLSASADFATPTGAFEVEPSFDPIPVHVKIVDHTTVMFDATVDMLPCDSEEAGGVQTYNAYCALTATGLSIDGQWSSFGVFVNGIGSVLSDYVNNVYWMWYDGIVPGETSLNTHIVESGDTLLLAYATAPIRMTTATPTPNVGDTVAVSAEYFDAMSWSWVPVSNAVFTVNGSMTTPEGDGVFDVALTEDIQYVVSATKEGLIASSEITIDPAPVENTGGGGGGNTATDDAFDVGAAVAFLFAQQEDDGSFGADLYTDWAAIGLAAHGASTSALRAYVKNDTDPGTLLQDTIRRAMALMALGVNPYTGTDRNYIADIVNEFDGTQFGDNDIYNDDVFAVLVLRKAGYSEDADMIKKSVAFILSKQQSNGGFLSVDITAATIQALTLVSDISGVDTALANARAYLLSTQQSNGGFANSFATSWVLQVISALNENLSDWEKNEVSPLDFLATKQETDGGVESMTDAVTNRVWATAYSIPGALGKEWGSILESFDAPSTSATNTEDSDTTPTPTLADGEVLGVTTDIPPTPMLAPTPIPQTHNTPTKKIAVVTPPAEEQEALAPTVVDAPTADDTARTPLNAWVWVVLGAGLLGGFIYTFTRK